MSASFLNFCPHGHLNKNYKELGFYSHGVLFIGQFKSIKLILVCTPAVLCQLDIVDYICFQCSQRVTEGATLFCTSLTMGSTAQPVNSQVMPLLLWSSFQNKRQHNYIFPL